MLKELTKIFTRVRSAFVSSVAIRGQYHARTVV